MSKKPARVATSRIRAIRVGDERPWTRPYERKRDLPRLLPLLAGDLDASTMRAHIRLIELLRKALWKERRRARTRHWSYDPARHAALVKAFRWETAALQKRS